MAAAGEFNHIIKILKHNVTRNEYGEQVDTYDTYISTRAKIVNLSAQRSSSNDETFYTDTKQLTIHSYIKLSEYDRVEIDGKQYKIVNTVPIEEYRHNIINIEAINE